MKRIISLLTAAFLIPCVLWAGEDQVSLAFSNSPMAEVLDRYSLLTGKAVLCQPGLGATVNLQTKPISKQKAIELIELALSQFNNFFVSLDEETMVVVVGGDRPAFPIPLITDPKEIPSGYQLITYQMRVRNLPVAQLMASLGPCLIGSARMMPSPDEKSLLIVAPAALVKGLIEVQDIMDVPMKKQVVQEKPTVSKE